MHSGSQDERIEMLKIALRDKGVSYNEHYNLSTAISQPKTVAPRSTPQAIQPEADDEGGLHL